MFHAAARYFLCVGELFVECVCYLCFLYVFCLCSSLPRCSLKMPVLCCYMREVILEYISESSGVSDVYLLSKMFRQ